MYKYKSEDIAIGPGAPELLPTIHD